MRFRPGETVVHPQYGVGRVVKLELRHFDGDGSQEYYEIAIATGTVWVPVEGPAHGVRRLTSKDELPKYRNLLTARPAPVPADSKERKLALAERLKGASFRSRCEVVRDLGAHGWAKALNESSGSILRAAREAVCSEWAAAEGISFEAATSEVDALLLQGRRNFAE